MQSSNNEGIVDLGSSQDVAKTEKCLAKLSCPFYIPKRSVCKQVWATSEMMMCGDHWHIVSIAHSSVGNC